jgi:hypothetical protein
MTERSEGIRQAQQTRSFLESANAFCEANR